MHNRRFEAIRERFLDGSWSNANWYVCRLLLFVSLTSLPPPSTALTHIVRHPHPSARFLAFPLQFSWMNTTEITPRYFHKFVMKSNSSRNCYTNGILRMHVLPTRMECVCVWARCGSVAQSFSLSFSHFFLFSIRRRCTSKNFIVHFCVHILCAWSIQFSTFIFCWLTFCMLAAVKLFKW